MDRNGNLNTQKTKKNNTKHLSQCKFNNLRRKKSFSELPEKPDLVLLCETKLNNKRKVQFKDYTFIRNDQMPTKLRAQSY